MTIEETILTVIKNLGGKAFFSQIYGRLKGQVGTKINLHRLLNTLYRRGKLSRRFVTGEENAYHKSQFQWGLIN